MHEGDLVAMGHELVTLDETQARARHRELRGRYADLLAMEARLQPLHPAPLDGLSHPKLPRDR